MNKMCIITTRAPYGSNRARDGIETLLVAASYDMEATLLVMGDGVFQFVDDQTPEQLPQKNTSAMLQALELYDIENVFLCQEDLYQRGLSLKDLTGNPGLIKRAEIPALLKQQDRILNF